jgi:alpha-galactosidase
MWCILAAPLIAGNDVRSMTPEIRAIMTDKEALAIDQDPLGKEGWRIRAQSGHEIWVRELAGGDWAVALLNTGSMATDLSIDFPSMWLFAGKFRIRDIWDKKDAGMNDQVFTKHVASHDVALLRLTKVK